MVLPEERAELVQPELPDVAESQPRSAELRWLEVVAAVQAALK